MKSREERLAKAEELYVTAFDDLREPRSDEYRHGVIAALLHRAAGIAPEKNCPCRPGTAGFDAFRAGIREGYGIWRSYIKDCRSAETGEFRHV